MATLRQGVRTVRKSRRCSNGHWLLPGDRVRYWVGTSDFMPGRTGFGTYEECITCVALNYAASWLSDLPMPSKGEAWRVVA